MHYSPEALEAFIQTVSCGSFSAAARTLGKSQSTISVLVASLEDSLGVNLFDRMGKYPQLTKAGQRLVTSAQGVLAANQRLESLSLVIAAGQEPQLTLAVSDILPAQIFNQLLLHCAEHFPQLELDIVTAEDADIISLINTERAIIGIINADTALPLTINGQTLAIKTTMRAWVAAGHPLAQRANITGDDLNKFRQLTLKTLHTAENLAPVNSEQWTANSYLLLMDMVQEGYGWSILPEWLVSRFSANLQPLPIAGLPRQVNLQLIYAVARPLGPAAQSVIGLLHHL
jgi:DNA-binding transcriptional LysR family regulator